MATCSPDDESKEFDDGYDENLMGDEEDQKKLAQMTEKEREQELFNRSERRETLKIRFEIERKLRSKAKKRDQEKKQVRARKRLRASEIYSSDESSDESDEYQPDAADLKATQEHQPKTTTKMNTRSALLSTSSSSSSSPSHSSDGSSASSASSASSESEQENDDDDDEDSQTSDRKRTESNLETIQDDFQMTLQDLKSIQLKRDTVEKWVYSPFFKDTAIGLFVKISVGNHPQTQEHMYKVAQIKDITQGQRVYAISLNQTKTDKQCLVKIGRVERTYAMSFISNRSFDDDDFNRWKTQLQADNNDMPSREFFNRKKRDLAKAINYNYEEKDIAYEVSERSRFKDHPYNFALKRLELNGEKLEAEAANDYARAERIMKQIDELEEKARQLEKSRSSSTFSAISFVNERNRYKNINESERVLKESKSVKTEDPFTRRKCTPMIVHNKNLNNNNTNSGDSLNNSTTNNNTDKNGQDVSRQSQHSTPTINNSTNNGKNSNNLTNNNQLTPKVESVKSVDDLIEAHSSINLEIDI